MYNYNYNLYKKLLVDLCYNYLLYVYREPLYNNRLITIARLPIYYIVVATIKKLYT
jgi:hypothetical protein